ncbi:glycosyltransferase family 4 protein [Clostridium butyricum]|uniref:glycosyltransferase family 4 protein n=1 Tax=Clostridium butyricum TaxID=1492 RepID=UPI003D3261A3
MINVLMIGSDFSVKGGMTTVVKSFLNNKFEGINITYVPTHIEDVGKMHKILFFFKSLIIIIKNLIMNNVDIVHIHLSERGSFFRKFIIVIISKIFKKKVIIHMHGADFKEFYNNNKFLASAIKYMLLKVDKVIVLGESWEKFVKKIDRSIKTCILRNSVDCPNETVKYDGVNVNILFLAVLIKRKGIFDLIKAASRIKDDTELKEYNIKFIIAGSGDDEKQIEEQIKLLKLTNFFVFKGWVYGEEKIDIIKSSQIMALPSYNEGLPVSILEAMSYGMPVISTNVGSIEDLIINGINGFLINPGDVEELYHSLKSLIMHRHKWEDFSNNSKDEINTNYNLKCYFRQIEQLYLGLSK